MPAPNDSITDDRQREIAQLQSAIAAQEGLRGVVPDEIIEATLATLQDRLDALQAPAGTEPKRKQVTIVFADVVGFTAMSETLDAELVAQTVNDLWALVDKVIVDHSGHIDKHIGDAVMAIWGVDTAREDDAERAVRAALELREAVATFCETHSLPLSMRVGVNTGPVLLGSIGTAGEFSAIGDTVNLASRLETAAPAGRVLISHDTYRQIRGIFDVEEQPPLRVKGKAQPIQTYVVLQPKPRAFRLVTRGIEGIETRMVGREDELSHLQSAYLAAMETETTHVVTVLGEAGVGKSRLLEEFEAWLELRPEDIRYHKGRATVAMQRTRVGLFRDVFALRFDILENDSRETAMAKFRVGMQPILDQDRADIAGQWLGFDFLNSPAVQALRGNPEFGTIARTHLTRYARELASQQSVVVLLEDIHWADESSLDLISGLANALPNSRLLIVCLARPTLRERRPDWGKDLPLHSLLELGPLSPAASNALVDELLQLVDSIPSALRDLLIDNAEGNPFYTEELVKTLIEDGVIVRENEQWRIDEDRLHNHRVPATLTNVLQARLDSLPALERVVVQQAAVVGRVFWDATVAEVAGSDSVSIKPSLNAIRKRDLVSQHARSTFSKATEFSFRHSLMRDVAYETVLLGPRRRYHERVANWLETNAGERLGEYGELIAEHFLLAGQEEKAVSYLVEAGKQAIDAGAYRVARAAFQQIVDLQERSGQSDAMAVEARLRLGQVCWYMGDYEVSRRALEQSLDLARALNAPSLEALALYYLSRLASSEGQYEESQAMLDLALPIARTTDRDVLMRVLYGLGSNAWRTGNLAAAEAYNQECLAIARSMGNRLQEAISINMLGLIAGERGDLETERECYEACASLAREVGDLLREAVALGNLGATAIAAGQLHKAVEYLEASLKIIKEIGRQESEAITYTNLSSAYAKLGEFQTARQYARDSMLIARSLGAVPRVLGSLLAWAEILVAEGESHEALNIIGLVLAHPVQEHQNRDEALRLIEATGLPPETTAAAQSIGASYDLDDVVNKILAAEERTP